MKIESKSPLAQAPGPQGQMSARDRAIAKLTQTSPVQNPSQVSPEEMSVVVPPQEGQSSPIESQSSEEQPPKEAKEEKPSEQQEEPLSKQYALLARKEKALRAKVQAQENAFKEREAALRAKEEAIAAKDAEYASKFISRDRLSEDPITTLLEAGISYDKITELALSQPQQADPATKLALQRLEAEIKAQKDAQERANKSYQEEQQRQYQQAINQITSDVKKLVVSDPAFETVQATNSVGDVVELIERVFKEDGVLLSVEEAAQEVENYLVEEAIKIAKLNKIQQRMQPKSPVAQKQTPVQSKPGQQPNQIKTLTNSVSASRPMSARERAILAFKGELK